jgi:hypothetical protein
MDEGLREAIALAAPDAERPLAIEVLIRMARQCQGFAREARAQPNARSGRRKTIHGAGTHSRSRRSSLSPTRWRAAGTAPQRRTDIRGRLGAALRPPPSVEWPPLLSGHQSLLL